MIERKGRRTEKKDEPRGERRDKKNRIGTESRNEGAGKQAPKLGDGVWTAFPKGLD